MSRVSAADLEALLYEALGSTLGIRVETENPDLLRQRLYTERRKNPEFAVLSLHISPLNPGNEVWICKKETQA